MESTKDEGTIGEEEDCLQLRAFKDFLKAFAGEVAAASSTELRSFSRSSNDSYQISGEELEAEILMIIYNNLVGKQCPRVFQMPLLKCLMNSVEPACRNSKECEIVVKGTSDALSNGNSIQYDYAKLQKFVAKRVEEFLVQLTDNAEQERLVEYAEEDALCKDGPKQCQCLVKASSDKSVNTPKFVSGQIKNKHRKMEDRNVCLDRFSAMYGLKPLFSFYGVFDGHSGPLAATYVSNQLPQILANALKLLTPSNTDDYRNLLEEAFQTADRLYIEKSITSGTTATAALLSYNNEPSDWPKHLYVAWVGDSKALLVSATVHLQLVKPHKPNNPEERKRIEDAGGSVLFIQGQWRVNGILNVARSIGDYSLDVVIAEPDFVDVPLTKAHDFLVLASDGLWDHVTEAKIAETVYEALSAEATQQEVDNIPKLLIDLAKEGDSQDNITVVVVFLNEIPAIVEHYKQSKVENETQISA